MTRAEVAARALAWVGTPYLLGGEVRGPAGGVDCVALIRALLAEATGRPAPPRPPFRGDWSSAEGGLALLSVARAHLVAVPAPGLASVVAWRVGRRVSHCGVITWPGRAVHAIEGRGVVETGVGLFPIVAAFDFPGVE